MGPSGPSRPSRRILGGVAWGVALGLAAALSPGVARAQSYQQVTAVTVGGVCGALDVFFIAYDLAMAERSKSPPHGLAVAEVTVMTLQLSAGISMFAVALQSDQRVHDSGIDRDLYLPLGAIVSVMAVPLLAHGIRYAGGRQGTGMHALHVLPSQIGDRYASGPGILVAGVF